jgi:hypothetical protein
MTQSAALGLQGLALAIHFYGLVSSSNLHAEVEGCNLGCIDYDVRDPGTLKAWLFGLDKVQARWKQRNGIVALGAGGRCPCLTCSLIDCSDRGPRH